MDNKFWDNRYSEPDGFAYGEAANEFLVQTIQGDLVTDMIKKGGNALCIAEGEGRNAVFLAQQGFHVHAMDYSSVGMDKLRQQAIHLGLSDLITTEVADLNTFDFQKNCGAQGWDIVVSIFAHTDPALRQKVGVIFTRSFPLNTLLSNQPPILRSSDLFSLSSLCWCTAVFHTSTSLLFSYMSSVLGSFSLCLCLTVGPRRHHQCPQTRWTLCPRGLPPDQHRSRHRRTASDPFVRDDRGLGVWVGWTDGAHDGATGTRGQRRQIPPGPRLRGPVHRSKVTSNYLLNVEHIYCVLY